MMCLVELLVCFLTSVVNVLLNFRVWELRFEEDGLIIFGLTLTNQMPVSHFLKF